MKTSALSSRNFRKYFYGSIFSLLGIWIQRLAIGWQAWQLSESAFIVGLVAAVQFLPVLFLTPFFGVIADRIQSRSSLIVLTSAMMLIALLLGWVTLQGAMTTEILVGLALAQGVVVSAYTPTRLTLVSDLVPQSLFPSAVAVSGIIFNLSRFVGPGLAGVIVASYGLGWAYIVNALTYLPVMLSLFLITIKQPKSAAPIKKAYLHQLQEGIKYVRDHLPIRQAILLSGVSAVFGRGTLEIMPAFAAMIFNGDSIVLAMLMSSAGVGAIVGSFAFYTRFLQVRMQSLIVFGVVFVGITLAMFGIVENLYTGIAAVMALGLATTLVSVGSQAFVQVKVENELRGRVMSLWTLFTMGGAALGSLAAGAMAYAWNASLTVLSFAGGCILFAVLAGAHKPSPKITESPD